MRLEDNKKIIRNETSLKILEKAKTHSKYILVLIVLFRLLNVDLQIIHHARLSVYKIIRHGSTNFKN